MENDDVKLRRRMDNLHKNIDGMKDDKFRISQISLNYIRKELLTTSFMNKYTNFSEFDEMIGCSGFKIENEIEFEDIICTDPWNSFIDSNTQFKDWSEMLKTSVLERATMKLKI